MGQKIGIDTPVIIYLLEKNPQYVAAVRNLMRRVQSGEYSASFSSIGLIEILTGPKRQGRYDIAAKYRETIIHFPNFTIRGINENIVDCASDLRAKYGIATPDAIHIATAIDFGAKKFITSDKGLRKVTEIIIEFLHV